MRQGLVGAFEAHVNEVIIVLSHFVIGMFFFDSFFLQVGEHRLLFWSQFLAGAVQKCLVLAWRWSLRIQLDVQKLKTKIHGIVCQHVCRNVPILMIVASQFPHVVLIQHLLYFLMDTLTSVRLLPKSGQLLGEVRLVQGLALEALVRHGVGSGNVVRCMQGIDDGTLEFHRVVLRAHILVLANSLQHVVFLTMLHNHFKVNVRGRRINSLDIIKRHGDEQWLRALRHQRKYRIPDSDLIRCQPRDFHFQQR